MLTVLSRFIVRSHCQDGFATSFPVGLLHGEVPPAVVSWFAFCKNPQATQLLESRLPSRLGLWQHDSCPTSFLVTQIQELNRAAVGLGDLPGED